MINIFDVICIGAALVDMVAQVLRHPAEDDEVFVSNLTLLSGGAAANTAYACAKIGLSTAFIGKLGCRDTFGNKIINDFKEVNVATKFIKYSEHYRTGSAYIALNEKGDRRIYAHSGAANYLSKEDLLEKELINTKIIFLSSLKNLEPFIEAAIIGRNNKIPVILNPGMLIIDQGFKSIKKLLEKVDILILSQNEYAALFDIEGCDLNEDLIQEKSSTLFKLGIQVIITTLGEKGALLLTSSRVELLPPLKLSSLIDTTGAGDAFSAGFIYGLVRNINLKFEHLKNNVKIGNFVAGNCIQELGARNGIPSREDLNFFLIASNKKI